MAHFRAALEPPDKMPPETATETEAPASPQPSSQPSVGLALGGGVARGWAHIGAVQRLQELGVRPDIVCGTSVGALVGGFWLAGALPALDAWARSLTKRRMLTYFDLMLNGSGLMGGKRLQKTMRGYLQDTKIEDLPQRFVAVTAEMSTGHETWLMEGDLADAIEAAYALPGVFPPRNVNGRWLIDGALVNPLPVSVCRALGARLVIAIGLHADAFGRAAVMRRERFEPDLSDAPFESPSPSAVDQKPAWGAMGLMRRMFQPSGPAPGLGSVMLASFNIVMDRVTRSRLAGDPPDVLILPKVGDFPLLDFDRADDLIQVGRNAVDDAMPEIATALDYLA
ncbi:MAG: patatin-like phospholipase family protein [Pseudomonadota bacterium]